MRGSSRTNTEKRRCKTREKKENKRGRWIINTLVEASTSAVAREDGAAQGGDKKEREGRKEKKREERDATEDSASLWDNSKKNQNVAHEARSGRMRQGLAKTDITQRRGTKGRVGTLKLRC